MEHSYVAIPPTAFVGLSCIYCNKMAEPHDSGTPRLLSRCHRCRRVWYCNSDCQKAHHSEHKLFCKTIHSVDASNDPEVIQQLLGPFRSTSNATTRLDEISVLHRCQIIDLYQRKRPLNKAELYLLSCEPRCLGCAKTDNVLRMEANLSGQDRVQTLKPCPRCMMVFFCDGHRSSEVDLHRDTSSDNGFASECNLSRQIRLDSEFRLLMPSPHLHMWRFIPRQDIWISLKGLSWDAALSAPIRAALPTDTSVEHLAGCLRLVSCLASTVMTVLYALEFCLGPTVASCSTLTIHVLGARAEFTSAVTYMYEAILHRLPNVKNLHILFCDNLGGSQGHVVKDVVLCKDCQNSSAHMIHEYIDHAYVKHLSRGTDFKAPDLCILMNGYIANHETDLWSETIRLLLERGVPSLFTANDALYARRDCDLLCGLGARLISGLTLASNPWGSLASDLNLDTLYGFCSANKWLVGCFS
ncbi:hypothetical protein R3P38DRAFT_3134592 [Favolaschia claudopus]|uniref:MYND-type domain-containing protein n=1 Tax=Favolaschia claudopus TaxID=2862362 RepID=A0AAV9Z6L9_9AGAR